MTPQMPYRGSMILPSNPGQYRVSWPIFDRHSSLHVPPRGGEYTQSSSLFTGRQANRDNRAGGSDEREGDLDSFRRLRFDNFRSRQAADCQKENKLTHWPALIAVNQKCVAHFGLLSFESVRFRFDVIYYIGCKTCGVRANGHLV